MAKPFRFFDLPTETQEQILFEYFEPFDVDICAPTVFNADKVKSRGKRVYYITGAGPESRICVLWATKNLNELASHQLVKRFRGTVSIEGCIDGCIPLRRILAKLPKADVKKVVVKFEQCFKHIAAAPPLQDRLFPQSYFPNTKEVEIWHNLSMVGLEQCTRGSEPRYGAKWRSLIRHALEQSTSETKEYYNEEFEDCLRLYARKHDWLERLLAGPSGIEVKHCLYGWDSIDLGNVRVGVHMVSRTLPFTGRCAKAYANFVVIEEDGWTPGFSGPIRCRLLHHDQRTCPSTSDQTIQATPYRSTQVVLGQSQYLLLPLPASFDRPHIGAQLPSGHRFGHPIR